MKEQKQRYFKKSNPQKNKEKQVQTGTITVNRHKEGIVETKDGKSIFIPFEKLGHALNRDVVKIHYTSSNGSAFIRACR